MGGTSGNSGISESFVACDMKTGRYRQFIVLIIICVNFSKSSLLFTLTNMTFKLAKGHSSKTKCQMSDIRTIHSGHLVLTFSYPYQY